MNLDETKQFWTQASDFPPDKEDPEVYGHEHTEAFGFDAWGVEPKKVLEYGCGGGSDTVSYAKRGHFVTYCDIVETNVLTTTYRLETQKLKGTPVILASSSPLPCKRASFDLVSCDGVLHHLPSPEPVLKEFHRVLKAKGRVAIMLYTETLWNSFAERMDSLMKTYPKMSQQEAFGLCTDSGGWSRAYTEGEGVSLIEKAGFRMFETRVYHKDLFRVYHAGKL